MNEQSLPPDLLVGPSVAAADGELPAMWHISLKLKAVHESGVDGTGVTFSINDTGVFEEHGYFGNQEFDFEHFNSAGGGMNDRNGHGTHCFGITTSVAPGSVGIWTKVLSDRGSGSTTGRWSTGSASCAGGQSAPAGLMVTMEMEWQRPVSCE